MMEDEATLPPSPKKPKIASTSTAAKKKGATTRKVVARKKTTAKKKTKKIGLEQPILSSSAPLGVIDTESGLLGTIECVGEPNPAPGDVMLALVDPTNNTDKYFVLQLIRKEKSSDEEETWVVYTRWGRTGTVGQAMVQDFVSLTDATQCFLDKFHEKTGLAWETRQQPTVGGKYRFVTQDFGEKSKGYSSAKWQYWVDDGVDGKTTAWYDYDYSGSCRVERLYMEHKNNPGFLSTRLFDNGIYTYQVDLQSMIQTNMDHSNHKQRRIRRCPMTEAESAAFAATGSKSNLASPPRPTRPSSAKTPVTPSPARTIVASSTAGVASTKSNSNSPPVDPDISIVGKYPSHYSVVACSDMPNAAVKWYDSVLNQCNIAGNNNKYYRLQLLVDASSGGSYYTWFKWGRVGEPARASSSTWMGPASLVSATKEFQKKYRSKTGNTWGSDSFLAKKGKYIPIEIDNNVHADRIEQHLPAPTEAIEKIEYLKSALDPATKELVEILFSKEIRNEALSTFQIDLRRLPLGVPSQQQIQQGVAILGEIEDLLQGTSSASSGSFVELSSRFYTTIPHSFGRARPPVIRDTDSLQNRYDMCNILLDMYSTSETIRNIEEKKPTNKKLLPCVTDQHYHSLKADLALVEKNSEEDKLIHTYFSQTKASWSKSTIVHIWKTSRNGEAERFQKYGKVANRRLLWHGTNIAVVAPILTNGLRIMPHSGGRVGSGIYLANLQEKSAQYTCAYGSKYACMFLCEAPLGKQHAVTHDGPHASTLKAPPTGFDSVHAIGSLQPKQWTSLNIDGNEVLAPQSKPVSSGIQSSFSHDEFLVYDEAQVRIRYVVAVK